jgi:hypothetical protein
MPYPGLDHHRKHRQEMVLRTADCAMLANSADARAPPTSGSASIAHSGSEPRRLHRLPIGLRLRFGITGYWKAE